LTNCDRSSDEEAKGVLRLHAADVGMVPRYPCLGMAVSDVQRGEGSLCFCTGGWLDLLSARGIAEEGSGGLWYLVFCLRGDGTAGDSGCACPEAGWRPNAKLE
jgi:hypothetical protein